MKLGGHGRGFWFGLLKCSPALVLFAELVDPLLHLLYVTPELVDLLLAGATGCGPAGRLSLRRRLAYFLIVIGASDVAIFATRFPRPDSIDLFSAGQACAQGVVITTPRHPSTVGSRDGDQALGHPQPSIYSRGSVVTIMRAPVRRTIG